MRPGEVRNHVTVDVLVFVFGKSASNIRRIASENCWRKVRVGRRMYYNVHDAYRDLRPKGT